MAQKIDPQDILIVRNIDVGCDDVTSDIVRVRRTEVDEETGRRSTYEEEVPEEWSHKDYFQVRWSNVPHRIKPGETRRMPRYIAEHYAKHLADHILQKMEKETGRTNLVRNPVERPKVMSKIIVGVDEYFIQGEASDEGERVAEEVEELNRRAVDLGKVDDPMMADKVDDPVDDIIKQVESDEKATDDKLPPRSELMKECAKLGIKFDIKETSQELADKIKAF